MKFATLIAKWMLLILIGIFAARLTSSAISSATEAPEIRDWQPGKPLFTHPVTENYAKAVSQQLAAKIQRDGVIERYRENTSPVIFLLFTTLAFLVDPIHLGLVALFAFFGWLALHWLKEAVRLAR